MGWGQVGQHRASGHKGGLGRSGHLKHLWSTVIKEDPDHFGHESTHRPASVSIITKKWASVRDLDDLFAKFGKQQENKKLLDLSVLGFDKLLGGGQIKNAYSIKIDRFTSKAEDKVKNAGGELVKKEKKIDRFTSKAEDKVKNAGEELVKKNG